MNSNENTKLKIIEAGSDYPKLKRVIEIFEEAFPPNERTGDNDVSVYSKENGFAFLVLEDENEPVGLALLRDCGEDLFFFINLAIAKEFRNKKYGTKALDILQNEYFKGKVLFGCIEALLPEADNYEQRVSRLDFYKRNGWFLYDKVIDGDNFGKFHIISTNGDVEFEKLLSNIKMLFPGHAARVVG